MQPVERKRHETDLYRLIQTEDFPIASVKTSGGLRLAALLSNVTAVWTGGSAARRGCHHSFKAHA